MLFFWLLRTITNVVAKLIDAHARVNRVCNKRGFTPLLIAVANNCEAAVSVLMQGGADPLLQTTRYRNAFDVAGWKNFPNIICEIRRQQTIRSNHDIVKGANVIDINDFYQKPAFCAEYLRNAKKKSIDSDTYLKEQYLAKYASMEKQRHLKALSGQCNAHKIYAQIKDGSWSRDAGVRRENALRERERMQHKLHAEKTAAGIRGSLKQVEELEKAINILNVKPIVA